jgi:cytosine deaminase
MASFPRMPGTLLRNATFADGTRGDVHVAGSRIVAVGAGGASVGGRGDAVDRVDLDGYVLLPAAVEPHAHLDKAFLAETVPNAAGDLLGAIDAMTAARHLLTEGDIVERAERAARLMAANGYTAVRTHADTVVEHGLKSVAALVEVRRRVADVIDVQIVALSGFPVTGTDGADQRALLGDALRAGADLVGGCPHLDEAGTRTSTEALLAIAAEHGVGVDFHVDETLDGSVLGLVDLIELVESSGFPHPVTASHCVSLGVQPLERQRAIAAAAAAAGVSVVSLPMTNLYLQGRDRPMAMPRALTAVGPLREAGVVVAAGADNLQDPFNPLGRACPFETAAMMMLAAHLAPEDAWDAVSSAARHAFGLDPAPIHAGSSADLLAVRALSLREAIAFAPADRIVWRGGQRMEPSSEPR